MVDEREFRTSGDERRGRWDDDEARRRRQRDEGWREPSRNRREGPRHETSSRDLARAEHLQRGVESPSRQRRTLGEGDDHFRSWRDRQIAEYDRDYQAFCRQRQEKFNADFDAWRAQRQARIEMAPTSIQESSGMTTEAVTSGAATTGPRERSRRPSRGRRKP